MLDPHIRQVTLSQERLPEIAVDGRQHFLLERVLVQRLEMLAGQINLAALEKTACVFIAGGVSQTGEFFKEPEGVGNGPMKLIVLAGPLLEVTQQRPGERRPLVLLDV